MNGNGEMTGMHWVKDAGYFMVGIALKVRATVVGEIVIVAFSSMCVACKQ